MLGHLHAATPFEYVASQGTGIRKPATVTGERASVQRRFRGAGLCQCAAPPRGREQPHTTVTRASNDHPTDE
ncbi:hypothetical protein GCM10010103_48360 [Streptomyces paradoxus]